MTEVLLNNMGFNYPLLLCTFHTACNWAGTAVFHRILSEDRPVFEPRQRNLIVLLSVISSLNTAIGKANVAVPATFDQIMRAAVPCFVVLITTRIFGRSVSRARKWAIIPVVCGMALAWYGEMQVSMSAAGVSFMCVALSAAKTVIWAEMLTGEFKVSPLHLLSRLAPMVLIQVAMYSFFRGEAFEIVGQWNELLGGYALYVVAATGVASFIISVCTMQATKFATPLTVSVLGVFKQLLVVGFSTYKLQRRMSRLNFLGVVLVVIGLVRYTFVSFSERRLRAKGEALERGLGKGPSSMVLPTTVAPAAPVKRARPTVGKTLGARPSVWRWWSGGEGTTDAIGRSR